ncbi:MAG TPA: hypothetical protein VEH84_06350 [Alphaproteobacteria bacterium]|nr:hypothetical protein [Alphaproteobacteria bacterium]
MRKPIGIALAGGLAAAALPALAYSDGEIARFLQGTAWCAFSYNQTTGYSHSRRAVFGGDGRLSVATDAEGGSSGPAGSVYGQGRGGDVYAWQVRGGLLMLSEDGQGWQSLELDARQTAGGGTILLVDGEEWAACD